VLEDHPHLRTDFFNVLDVVGQLDAIYDDATLLMLLQPVDAANKRRFARPGRAADHDPFLPGYRQVDASKHMKFTKPLVHVHDFNHGVSRRLCRRVSGHFLDHDSLCKENNVV
jgi:hypothetical protein